MAAVVDLAVAGEMSTITVDDVVGVAARVIFSVVFTPVVNASPRVDLPTDIV